MKLDGIIHIGAHYGEEIPTYIDCGVKHLVMFEPLEDNFNTLAEKIKDFDANIIMHKTALGSEAKKETMYVSSNDMESSSILKPKEHLNNHPDISFPTTEDVDVNRLDDYDCKGYNFIAMDVQGYELEVLKGARKTLEHIEYVYCEVNRDEVYENNAYVEEIDEFLSAYNMERMETTWGGGIWGDALYIRKNLT